MWKCHAEQAGGSLLYASSKRADVDGRGRNPRVEKYSATRCVARSLFNYSNPKKIRQKSVRYYFSMVLLSCVFFEVAINLKELLRKQETVQPQTWHEQSSAAMLTWVSAFEDSFFPDLCEILVNGVFFQCWWTMVRWFLIPLRDWLA